MGVNQRRETIMIAYQRGETNLICVLKDSLSTRGDKSTIYVQKGSLSTRGDQSNI